MLRTSGIQFGACILAVAFVMNVSAAEEVKMKSIEVPIFDCKSVLNDYVAFEKPEPMATPDAPPEKRTKKSKKKSRNTAGQKDIVLPELKGSVPADKVDGALAQILKFKYLSTDIKDVMLKEIGNDPEAGLSDLERISKGECAVESYRVVRALMTTATDKSTSNDARQKISKGVREWFGKKTAPTYLRASTNLKLMEFAKDSGLWKFSNSAAKTMKTDREKLDRLIAEANKAYYGKQNVEIFSQDFHKDFKKIQPVLTEEVEEASNFIGRSSKIVSDLKI